MAGHSKFKNIQHRKGAQDKKRAKLFTRLVREILTAARSGAPDPNLNPRLRTAMAAARTQNLPKERIDKALSQAANPGVGDNYDEIRYEGFAHGGFAIIIEALTDNKNRTASEVRSAFTKQGGNLGETGSVNFMFDKLGIIQFPVNVASSEAIFEAAVDVGANDAESDDEYHTIYTAVEDLGQITEKLTAKFGAPEDSYLGWKPQDTIMIDELEKAEKILKLIDVLEDNDDVQRVYSNHEFSESVIEALNKE
jgi:YebC/PmpR family DNA-binding regulatory protein